MEHSFAVGIRMTREKLLDVLSCSGLPLDVLDMLLGEIKTVVHAQAEAEYQQELARAEKEKKEQEEKEKAGAEK